MIFVDIDGTLTNETEGYGEAVYAQRTPKQTVIDFVNRLYNKGETIIIWTARYEQDRKVTINWLRENGVKYHDLIFNKPKYKLFIDDLSMNPDIILKKED